MVKKSIAIAVSVALLASVAIPALNYFNESNGNDSVVFEYSDHKVYETEIKPYVDYYSKINESFDTDSKNYAVDNYIRSVLLSKFSQDLGFTVTDNEVFEYINKSPIFQDGDKFSKTKYDTFIKNLGVKVNIFEGEVRKDLYIDKLMKKMDSITNIENYYFDIINETLAQKRVVEKIRLNMNKYAIVYDDALMKKKYEDNKMQYKKLDQIIFSKYTYINPLNQSEIEADQKRMLDETNDFYNSISKMTSKEVAKRLTHDKIQNSSMSLNTKDFSQLVGTKNADKLENGSVLIDKADLDKGVVTIYQITNITKGEEMNYSEAEQYVRQDYANDMRLAQAQKHISDYSEFKEAVGDYFDKYSLEVIDPLKNDQTELMYNLVYSIPIGGMTLYQDPDTKQYYFLKVKDVQKIELTDEQISYFKTSQNNMYKQFMLLSMYESIKQQYHLKRYKKES